MPNHLLTRIFNVYGSPELEDLPAWVAEAEAQLQGFPHAILDKAATAIIRSSKRFPTIAAMIQACEDAADQQPKQAERPKHPEWSKEAIAAADRLIQSDLGRQAADEGWSLALHDYCRVHRALPDAMGIARCKRNAREFDEAFADATKVGGIMGPSLMRLGETMLARRYEKADLSNGILP